MGNKPRQKHKNLRRSLRLMPKSTENDSPSELKYEEQDTLLTKSYQCQEKSPEYEKQNKFIKNEKNTEDTVLEGNIKCEEKPTECISRLKRKKHENIPGTPLPVKSEIVLPAAADCIATQSNFPNSKPEDIDVKTENKTSNSMKEGEPTENENFPELLMEIIIGEKYLNIITPYDFTRCRKPSAVQKGIKRRRRRRH